MKFTQEHGRQRHALRGKRDRHLMEQYALLSEGLAGDHPRMAAAKSDYYRAAARLTMHDASHRLSHTDALEQERGDYPRTTATR